MAKKSTIGFIGRGYIGKNYAEVVARKHLTAQENIAKRVRDDFARTISDV